MFITLSKVELLKLLDEQLERAKEEDKRSARSHKDDEKLSLIKFRADLRGALKWDYVTAKKTSESWESQIKLRAPRCPVLEAPRFSNMIDNVSRDMRKSPYRIHDGSDIDRALKWVPKSKRKPVTVCDSEQES